jgi:RNase P/RNase MRP subunit POP5
MGSFLGLIALKSKEAGSSLEDSASAEIKRIINESLGRHIGSCETADCGGLLVRLGLGSSLAA